MDVPPRTGDDLSSKEFKRGEPWSIRAVQLDLARQKETIETIRQFMHFAAEWGYNTILLYLEGIVRTSSFDAHPHDAGYSTQEMSQIVAAASEVNLDVVPCV